jgi:hypothetical protein
MSFLRSLWSDLVEKRLWPIAIALLLALVAVPVLLGGGAQGEPAAVGATGTTGSLAAVTLEATAPVRGDRDGVLRNPFKPRAKAPADPNAAPAVTSAPAAGTQSAPASTPAPSGGGSFAPAGGGGSAAPVTPTPAPAPSTPAPARPKATDAYAAVVHFGPLNATKDTKVLARLTPIRVGTTPYLVFTGVLDDRRTAVFLLSSDVQVAGDGTCRPRKSSCETVELTPGDHELVVVTLPDGTKANYSLGLVAVDNSSDAAKAAVAAAASRAGLGATPRATSADEVDGYRFDRRTGLLRRLPSTAHLGAYGASITVAQAGFAFGAATGTTAP